MAAPTVSVDPAFRRDLTADRARSQSRQVPLLTWHPRVQAWASDELARGHGRESTRTYGVQINAFVKWLSATLDSEPDALIQISPGDICMSASARRIHLVTIAAQAH